jgi:uncharacterized protein (DUF2267 family)
MEELIKKVTTKAGISEDQAKTSITTVIDFLKEKLPTPIAAQLDGVLGADGGVAGAVGGIAAKVGGAFGK